MLSSFLKGSSFFKFEMLLHNLIVKVCYEESLFYIITISIYGNFWTFELIHYVVGKENIVYVKDLLSFWLCNLCKFVDDFFTKIRD
jgi:hypothetical protein